MASKPDMDHEEPLILNTQFRVMSEIKMSVSNSTGWIRSMFLFSSLTGPLESAASMAAPRSNNRLQIELAVQYDR